MRALIILFVVGLCLFLLTRFRKATPGFRKAKEPFANNDMDEVMDLYCETNQQGKDDYKGPWDAVSVPKCESSVCTPETCYTLDEKQFGTRSYYWKPEFAPQMRSNIDTGSVCVTKHDVSSNIYCDEKPDEGKCAQNIFNPIPDRKCCVWNSTERKYVCSDYNHFLNDRGQCEFREVYGAGVTTEGSCSSTYPRCDGSYLCPSGKTKYQTYDDNGECRGGTVADCENCEDQRYTCDTFDPDKREWTSTKYRQMFGLPDHWTTQRECDYWEVNDMGAQQSYNRKPDVCYSSTAPPKTGTTESCTSLASKRNDSYLRSYITYNQTYDSTGTNLIWTDGSDEQDSSYFHSSNLECHPVCPMGTVDNPYYMDPSGFYGSFPVSACAPCPENQYYNETTSNCHNLDGCDDVKSNMVVPRGEYEDGRRYYNANNTCEACGVNGFTSSRYATDCTNCDSGKEYYDSNVNLIACSECDGATNYITIENGKRVCNTCPSSTDRRGQSVVWDGSNCILECKPNAFGGGAYENGSYPNCVEKCGDGQYKSSSNTCETCPPGETNPYYDHEMSNCQPCPKNTYQEGTGCHPCGSVGTRMSGLDGKTSGEGASNKTECYVTCAENRSNIYWDGSSYPLEDCGRSACTGWGGFLMSNIDVPQTTKARFGSKIRIPKAYSKPASGIGSCSNNVTSLSNWACRGTAIRDIHNNVYCCGVDSETKQVTDDGYCECIQNVAPHEKIYNTRTDKCDIECSSSNPSYGIYQKRGNETCDIICNSNYYFDGTDCKSCPNGGYSSANRRYNRQGIGTCYKNKNTHSNICTGEGQILDTSAPVYFNPSITDYDQSYCRNQCPAGFEIVNTDARHTNMTNYEYKLESETDRGISCPVRYSGISNLYSLDLNTENKTLATSPYQSDSNYYKCPNDIDNINFGNYYSQKRAMCCPPEKLPDFRTNRCKYSLNQYVFDSVHSRLHPGVHAYKKGTILSDTNTFTPSYNTLSPYPDRINRYGIVRSGGENSVEVINSNLNDISNEYVYRCEDTTGVVNVDPDSANVKLVCCPENLPHYQDGVCTVKCTGADNRQGITYNGRCFVEANTTTGKYVLGSGDFIAKYSEVYGLGIGPQERLSRQNCTLYIDIDQDNNIVKVDIYNDGSTITRELGLSMSSPNILSTGGNWGRYQPTLFVEVLNNELQNNFMFIISSSGDIWHENTQLYYHVFRPIGGINYLSFIQFPKYNGKFNTQIPANVSVPTFTIENFAQYAENKKNDCPRDNEASDEKKRGISGSTEEGLLELGPQYYLWDKSAECTLRCAKGNEVVHFNTTTNSYNSCPPQPYSPYWNEGGSTDTKRTCVRQAGGVVADWQDTPTGTCSNAGGMESASPDLKVQCLGTSVWDQSSLDCVRYDNYWVVDRTSSALSYDGDQPTTQYRMDTTIKKQVQEKVSASSPSNLDLGSNNLYVCSAGVRVTGRDICCENDTDSVHFHDNGYTYCCRSNEKYIHGTGCVPSGCSTGILIGTSGSELCFSNITLRTGYYPVKFNNTQLYLQTNNLISGDINNAVFVNDTGQSFFYNGMQQTTITGFNYRLDGFYKNSSNDVLLVFNKNGNKYLINRSGIETQIPSSSKYVNADASEYYLDLNPGSNCSSDDNGNSLKTTTQYYITSTDECEYNCPSTCDYDRTYFGSNNLSQCGFRTDCEEQIVDDYGVIKTVIRSNVPCASNCCDSAAVAGGAAAGLAAATSNCDPGTYYNGTSCSNCPAGTYRSTSTLSSNSQDCTPCDTGMYSGPGASNCSNCDGTVSEDKGSCRPTSATFNCPAGKFHNGTSCVGTGD